MSLFRHFSRL